MTIDDELLGAYVDGELDATRRAEVEAALASRPEFLEHVARMRATRERLRRTFDSTLSEPVPAQLLSAMASAAASEPSRVARFFARRESKAKQPSPSWSLAQWGALAASVVVAALVGYLLLHNGDDAEFFKQQDNELLADGALATALSTQLASEQAGEKPVRIGLTFRTRSAGHYCRTFTLRGGASSAGIACREDQVWHVRALAPLDYGATAGDAQQASTALPGSLLGIVQAEIDGAPLDAAGERSARDNGWLERTPQR